ncbi:protein kinase [Streptomyces sp. NPDC000405]|uniref:protein kinase n=1 Tax=Streptomyces sp. NPDC000405 TaxID=3161033 RepID=UPI00398D2900
MDDYAGRVLADRYRLPLPPSEAFELVETRAFDTYSGQEVLVRQVPLPEVVDAEVLDGPHSPTGSATGGAGARRTASGPGDPAVRRALVAATAAAQIPDHPRLDQVFHVFAEAGSLWIVSELVSARPLAALLAERTLSPHRAAEVAADVLTALRALHTQGWTHRNITARTVLICDDGRAILTGLAAGAAEEALCGYDPVPETAARGERPRPSPYGPGSGAPGGPGTRAGGVPRQGGGAVTGGTTGGTASSGAVEPHGAGDEPDEARNARAARSGAIAAYHAAARAAARAAAEGATRPAAGASTWGGGRASSGSAPAPGATRPWTPDGLPRGGTGAGGARTGGTGAGGPVPGGARGPGVPGQGGRPGASAQGRPGAPGRGAQPGVSAQGGPAVVGQGVPAGPGQGGPADGSSPASPGRSSNGWGHPKGPADALAAERARQARMVVVGAVTERWAPEQAWPVQENWQLAPPVGPAADLWALGALLFRVVQGHAPYPEESAAELVQVVCAEPPAYAEECGALRPVVESLMRKDPAERPEFEELRGWLRSLIRSAPEPELGSRTVTVPSIGAPAPGDPRRLPVVRRRGELVRGRRVRASARGAAAAQAPENTHGRHKRTAAERRGEPPRAQERSGLHTTGHLREERVPATASPLRLGRLLLGLILLALVGAVLYAVLFMPRAEEGTGRAPADRTGAAGALSAAPGGSAPAGTAGRASTDGAGTGAGSGSGAGAAKGFALRKDAKGFAVAVAEDWQRRGENARGQVVYAGGDYELIVVPGRDTVAEFGGDPMAYQQDKEPELAPYRASSWSGSSGLRRVDIGGTATAEGTFHWNDSGGRQIYVRNAAMILGDRYHLLQVRGPMDEQRSVDTFFDQAMATYRADG